MKILFHGASVTQQSGESSYLWHLKKLIDDSKKEVFIRSCGYGGNHLNDAGFLTIDEDSNADFDICILDWNTTTQDFFEEAKLEHILRVLTLKRINPVFVIFARKDSIFKNRKSEEQVLSLCKKFKILCYDYRKDILPDVHLRDFVHTNTLGAEIYAKNLFKALFFDLVDQSIDFLHIERNLNPLKFSIQPFYFSQNISEGKIFKISLKSIEGRAEIIAKGCRGPSSPLVRNNHGVFSVWDKWSHYERDSFIILDEQVNPATSEILLEILSDEIDYSSCVKPFNYNGHKILKIIKLYAINCYIVEASTHLPIKNLYIDERRHDESE